MTATGISSVQAHSSQAHDTLGDADRLACLPNSAVRPGSTNFAFGHHQVGDMQAHACYQTQYQLLPDLQ